MTDIIDDVFNGEIEDQEEVGEAPTKTQEIEEPEGEESEAEAEDKAEPPAAEDETEEKSVPVAALKSERQKRQAAEAELNELKKKNAPEEADEDVDDETFTDRVNISREVLIEAFPDYEEKESVFADLAKDNKLLRQQLRQSKNPAKFAYETAKEHLEFQEIKLLKSSDDWAEFQKWKKEQSKQPPEDKRKKSILEVPNLNKATAKGSNSTPVQSLPELGEMFEDSPF